MLNNVRLYEYKRGNENSLYNSFLYCRFRTSFYYYTHRRSDFLFLFSLLHMLHSIRCCCGMYDNLLNMPYKMLQCYRLMTSVYYYMPCRSDFLFLFFPQYNLYNIRLYYCMHGNDCYKRCMMKLRPLNNVLRHNHVLYHLYNKTPQDILCKHRLNYSIRYYKYYNNRCCLN